MPLVSVVMPARNAERTIAGAVASVMGQTLADLELLVADDGSSDATGGIVRQLARGEARIRYAQIDRSGGPASARNLAIGLAQGRYLAFLDADDLWLPTKLERQLELARRTGAVLTYTAYHRAEAALTGGLEGWAPQGRVVHVPPVLGYRALARHNQIGCLTAMVDRRQSGPVRLPDIPGAEDFGLWLALLRGGRLARGLDEPLAVYRASGTGTMSARRVAMARAVWRLLRVEEGFGPARAAFNLAGCLAGGLAKSRI
jgi:glycosyltransferase involved in cell wall biosynthesis